MSDINLDDWESDLRRADRIAMFGFVFGMCFAGTMLAGSLALVWVSPVLYARIFFSLWVVCAWIAAVYVCVKKSKADRR